MQNKIETWPQMNTGRLPTKRFNHLTAKAGPGVKSGTGDQVQSRRRCGRRGEEPCRTGPGRGGGRGDMSRRAPACITLE